MSPKKIFRIAITFFGHFLKKYNSLVVTEKGKVHNLTRLIVPDFTHFFISPKARTYNKNKYWIYNSRTKRWIKAIKDRHGSCSTLGDDDLSDRVRG
jgi:hypothetical protein